MEELKPSDELELLERPMTWRSNSPGAERIYRARNEAAVMLDLDETVYDLWRERNWRWRALQNLTREVLSRERTTRTEQLVTSTVDSFLNSNKGHVEELGKAFCRWDGIPPAPGAQTLGENWKPLKPGIAALEEEQTLYVRVRMQRRYAVLATVILSTGLSSCTATPAAPVHDPDASAVSSTPPAVDCATSMKTGALPEWARAGFRDDGTSFRHVEGLRGGVVGVVFGYPLTSPPRPSRENKILWVAHNPTASRIHIDAQLAGSGPIVQRDVGFGGGQSIIDLPSPGCWRLVLRWDDDETDTVDLPYAASH